MSIAEVGQVENSSATGLTSMSATSALTLAAGDVVEISILATPGTTFSAVNDGLGNTYSPVGSTPIPAGAFTLYTYVAQNCVSGSATPFASSAGANINAIFGKQISGAAKTGAVLGYNGVFAAGVSPGLNALVSGNVAVGATPINVLVSGFSCNTQANTPIMTAGTSPLAFTGRDGVWSIFSGGTALTLPEDLRVVGATGNVQATFGASNPAAFDNFLTAIVVYAELVAPSDTIPCGTAASASSVATGTGGLALPAFAVGDCIVVLTMAQTASALTETFNGDGSNAYTHLQVADNHSTEGFILSRYATIVTTPLASPVLQSTFSGSAKLGIAAVKVGSISPGSPFVPGGNAQHLQTTPSGTNSQVSGLTTSANTNIPVTLVAWGLSVNFAGAPTAGSGFTPQGTAWSAFGAPCLTCETQTSSSLIQQQATFTPIGGSDTYTFLDVFNQLSVAFQIIMGQACL